MQGQRTPPIANTLGERIRDLRFQIARRLGATVTLKEFGEIVASEEGRDEPWTAATVSRWEGGKQSPMEGSLRAMAQLAGVDVADFIGAEPGAPPISLPRRGPGPVADSDLVVSHGEATLPRRLSEWRLALDCELQDAGWNDQNRAFVAAWLDEVLEFLSPEYEYLTLSEDQILVLWEHMADTVRRRHSGEAPSDRARRREALRVSLHLTSANGRARVMRFRFFDFLASGDRWARYAGALGRPGETRPPE